MTGPELSEKSFNEFIGMGFVCGRLSSFFRIFSDSQPLKTYGSRWLITIQCFFSFHCSW